MPYQPKRGPYSRNGINALLRNHTDSHVQQLCQPDLRTLKAERQTASFSRPRENQTDIRWLH